MACYTDYISVNIKVKLIYVVLSKESSQSDEGANKNVSSLKNSHMVEQRIQ